MQNIWEYIKESYHELIHKVTWPSWSALMSQTWIVIVASGILALLIFVMDFVAKTGTGFIYGLD